jgi:nucleotide-binding universal stress UspA family protein
MATVADRIVVGIDGSQPSKDALRWALEEARLRNAEVEVVHAWEFPAVALADYGGVALPVLTPEDLEKQAEIVVRDTIAEVIGTDAPVPFSTLVRMGHAAEVLVAASKGAAMLVVGARGRGGFATLLLGSVSSQVVHHSQVPVVVIPPAA